MAITVQIGNESFPSKAAATARCQEILNAYPGSTGSGPGQPQEVTDPTHTAFLTALVRQHTEAEEKIGSGIAGFKIQVSPTGKGGTRCFWVVHPDGTATHFSYKSCF